ncbi:MAG: hypothetical protein WC455_18440 [Dehalococcoidia bacterium]
MGFLEGFSHVFDLFGALSPGFPDPNEDGFSKDRLAIYGDWKSVGDELRKAMGIHVPCKGKKKTGKGGKRK